MYLPHNNRYLISCQVVTLRHFLPFVYYLTKYPIGWDRIFLAKIKKHYYFSNSEKFFCILKNIFDFF